MSQFVDDVMDPLFDIIAGSLRDEIGKEDAHNNRAGLGTLMFDEIK